VDVAKHAVTVKNKPGRADRHRFKLLATLLERRGRVQTRDALLNDVWGYEGDIDTRTVDTHMRRLREKLGRAGDYIENRPRRRLPVRRKILTAISTELTEAINYDHPSHSPFGSAVAARY